MKKVINLMPIDVTYAPDGDMDKLIVFPKSGRVAKLERKVFHDDTVETENGEISFSYELPFGKLHTTEVESGNEYPFPEEKNWVVYLVNILVAQKLAGREDIFSPAVGSENVIRDESGKVLAVTKFVQFL